MKRLLWSLSGGVTLLLILLGGLAWLLATADGFRWLSSELSVLSQGKLKIEGVEGHLFSPQLLVRNLEIASDTKHIRIVHARLDWQPRALWHRRLDIRQLTPAQLPGLASYSRALPCGGGAARPWARLPALVRPHVGGGALGWARYHQAGALKPESIRHFQQAVSWAFAKHP